jgi:hypothetical protein
MSAFLDADNISIEALSTLSGGRERNRGYYRLQRMRKIQKRTATAERLGIDVVVPGRFSKSSCFGLHDSEFK